MQALSKSTTLIKRWLSFLDGENPQVGIRALGGAAVKKVMKGTKLMEVTKSIDRRKELISWGSFLNCSAPPTSTRGKTCLL